MKPKQPLGHPPSQHIEILNGQLIEIIPEYYRTWISGSTLVAIIPALAADEHGSQSYYSVHTTLGSQATPVFLFENKAFIDGVEIKSEGHSQNKCFLFDTEFAAMWSYEPINPADSILGESHFVKQPTYEQTKSYILANPFVLFFHGNDDGHVGLRFPDQASALTYLQSLSVFEDVFEQPILGYHN